MRVGLMDYWIGGLMDFWIFGLVVNPPPHWSARQSIYPSIHLSNNPSIHSSTDG
jgi:hypothetical protein